MMSFQYGTVREHDKSIGGGFVEFDRRLFRAVYDDLRKLRRSNEPAIAGAVGRVLRGLWIAGNNKNPPPGTMTMLAADVAALAALIDRQPQAIDSGCVGASPNRRRDV